MTGKQGAAILKALEALQAKAAEAGVDDDDEHSCDSPVKARFMRANTAENTAEMKPQHEGGKKKKQAFGGGGRK